MGSTDTDTRTRTKTATWRYRETVLALSTLAFFGTMAGRVAISPVVPQLTAAFGVLALLLALVVVALAFNWALALGY